MPPSSATRDEVRSGCLADSGGGGGAGSGGEAGLANEGPIGDEGDSASWKPFLALRGVYGSGRVETFEAGVNGFGRTDSVGDLRS